MADKNNLDKLIDIGCAFNWMEPLSDLLHGYNTVEYEGWDNDCKKKEKELKAQGVKCRTQFTGNGWRVISKR